MMLSPTQFSWCIRRTYASHKSHASACLVQDPMWYKSVHSFHVSCPALMKQLPVVASCHSMYAMQHIEFLVWNAAFTLQQCQQKTAFLPQFHWPVWSPFRSHIVSKSHVMRRNQYLQYMSISVSIPQMIFCQWFIEWHPIVGLLHNSWCTSRALDQYGIRTRRQRINLVINCEVASQDHEPTLLCTMQSFVWCHRQSHEWECF